MSGMIALAKLAGWKFLNGEGRMVVVPPAGDLQAIRFTCGAAGQVMGGSSAAPLPIAGDLFLADTFTNPGKRFALFTYSVEESAGSIPFASGAFVIVNNVEIDARNAFTQTATTKSSTPYTQFKSRQSINMQQPRAFFDLRAVDVDVINVAVGFLAYDGAGVAPDTPVHVDVAVW